MASRLYLIFYFNKFLTDIQNQNKFYTAYLGQKYIQQNKLAYYTFLKNETFHNPRFHTEEHD